MRRPHGGRDPREEPRDPRTSSALRGSMRGIGAGHRHPSGRSGAGPPRDDPRRRGPLRGRATAPVVDRELVHRHQRDAETASRERGPDGHGASAPPIDPAFNSSATSARCPSPFRVGRDHDRSRRVVAPVEFAEPFPQVVPSPSRLGHRRRMPSRVPGQHRLRLRPPSASSPLRRDHPAPAQDEPGRSPPGRARTASTACRRRSAAGSAPTASTATSSATGCSRR